MVAYKSPNPTWAGTMERLTNLHSLRGPAPIHHALLQGDTHVGISLQTLDEKAFDHGVILAQTPAPGLHIPPRATLQDVLRDAAHQGAEMLVQGLRSGLHLPPYRDVGWRAAQLMGRELRHAPKVTKSDGHVNWDTWTADQFVRFIRVMGSVWMYAINSKGEKKRIIFPDGEAVAAKTRWEGEIATMMCGSEGDSQSMPGGNRIAVMIQEDNSCLFDMNNNTRISVKRVRVEGRTEQLAAIGLGSFLMPAGA